LTDASLDIAKIVAGLVVLISGGECLVRGAVRLAAAARVSPLIIGLTVVAFGTSAPELAVAIQSAVAGSSDIAVGNVVGSNIFNLLFILGISALIVPLVVSSRLIRWDVPLMVVASFLLLVLGWDQRIGRLDGLLLFGCLLAYTYWCIRQSRKESRAIQEEFSHEIPIAQRGMRSTLIQLGLIVVGLVLLGIGSNLLISGSVAVAKRLGMSELIIGLTIVAAGTSLPEVVTSIVAAVRGERDIAVGNLVGSNLFNILCVLGLSSLVAPEGIAVSPTALRFDIPVMIAVAVACLPIFFTGNRIARWEGGLFFFYYVAYTTYLVLDATESTYSRTLTDVMVGFVIPLTVVTLMVACYRGMRGHHSELSAVADNDGAADR